nr:MAG TPA: Protein of unknown function (DUF3383) [Caudoviricetes sp.]
MANNFKYVTTPTGSLSGASMARQTEDAINSVANTAEVARVTVLEAQTTIEGALNTAQNAQAAAEAGLIEIRNALQQLSQMNIPSGDGQVGKFLSTDGTRLLWQAGMRYQGQVATKSALPKTSYTHGVLVGGDILESALSTLQAITNGGFNINVGGALKEISGLDFSTLTALSGVPAILNAKISDWGTATYAETTEEQETLTYLYPWINQAGTARIYVKDVSLTSTSVLYNADGTPYTGTDFAIEAKSEGGYVVTYNGTECQYTPNATISVTSTETVTHRRITITTVASGANATIGQGLTPSLQTTTDVSVPLQLQSGTATNGQTIKNSSGDVYFVVDENTLYFWNGTLWIRFVDALSFQTVLTLEADKTSGTALTIPNGGSYLVGQKKLKVNYNGCVCYLGTNFEEVGAAGTYSTTFKLLFDAKTGDEIEICIG